MKANVFEKSDKTHLTLSDWNDLLTGLKVGFSTKSGGVSTGYFTSLNLGLHVQDQPEDVRENRETLAKALSFPLKNWVFAEQVHSDKIMKVNKSSSGKGTHVYEDGVAACDGLYTSEKGIMLSLCFADCVPLFFIAPKHSLIGVAHAGWKGTVKDIAGKMVKLWQQEEEVDAKDIFVAIGPSIGGCCYIVDDKVISSIDKQVLVHGSMPYNPLSNGKYQLDLKLLNEHYLRNAGIFKENILVSDLCTSCEKGLFFSHRRDNGLTGRMLSFIGINEEVTL
ncbi:peptidoglycan editing factor PgeF [Bacillus sp. UMB0899]|uniref:peptidoglycan editing factor PgeF n=1 Tax=Metabacillus schmidteae TaxID=2730405 RepID=UPI000C80D94B|nr:peptidoglycan editing factor PgeF [Metabacillus schmidteae]PMC38355.1 peptidoglycan editing factor PgeF [Bacillus sp. UMB0899]